MIAAAGSGERLGAGGPKAFAQVAGRPLLAWSVSAFAASPSVDAAVIVAPAGHEAEVEGVALTAGGELSITVVAGGATRAESVRAGVGEVEAGVVAVHDAARPLVTPALIERLVELLAATPDADGVIAASPVVDTLKRVRGPRGGGGMEIESTESREWLWAAETPQVFRTEALRAAHFAAPPGAATDDAILVERQGGTVLVAQTPHPNLKVTTPADLRVVELMLTDRSP